MTKIHNILRSWMLPLDDIDKFTPKTGKIFELGCGEGVISTFLALNKKRNVTGVDINSKRLPVSTEKNLRFLQKDITRDNIGLADAVIISDVLHHIEYGQQKKLLASIYKNLLSNGVLIIKEIDTGEFIRSKLSRFWDFIFYPKDKIYFNDAKELKEYVEKLGFSTTIRRPSRLFPGSTTLLVCKK